MQESNLPRSSSSNYTFKSEYKSKSFNNTSIFCCMTRLQVAVSGSNQPQHASFVPKSKSDCARDADDASVSVEQDVNSSSTIVGSSDPKPGEATGCHV
jgi:hypothetical protein